MKQLFRTPALAALILLTAIACDEPKKDPPPAAKHLPTFLFLSDVHLDSFSDSTEYGSDTGMQLWKRFLAKTDSLLSDSAAPDFIVYTGDLPAHYAWDSTAYLPPADRGTHNQNLSTILSGLRTIADKHHKPLFYMPGNNDGLAGDYYSFADSMQQTPFALVPDPQNPYPALNINSGSDKAPCIVSAPHPTMGYYSCRPVPGLRMLALNTVIYSKHFTAVDGTKQLSDGNEQMAWIAAQLAEAAAQNEKVYIAMHIPPGTDAYSMKPMWTTLDGQKTSWDNQFLALVNKYQSTISGILYGHTHMDEVRRLYDSTNTKITKVAISCPGVTPQHNNNPGFKIVEYDPTSKELMNFTTYHTTLNGPFWGKSTYTFSAAFGAAPEASIFDRLSKMSLTSVDSSMNTIFTVKNGAPSYNTQGGIEVKWE